MKATVGEYNNYFSDGLFVEMTEPLFVKKNWVPQWLWNLVSDPKLSYFEHDTQGLYATTEAQVKLGIPAAVGPWDSYNFNYNNGVNDPSHLLDGDAK